MDRGGFADLDPASSAEANKVIHAARYFTKSDDGLGRVWSEAEATNDSVFLNPPGGKTDDGKSKVKLWWITFVNQVEYGFGHGLFLSFSIEAAQVTQIGCERSLLDFPTCFFARRVDYIDPATGKPVKGNTHSSCITYVPGWKNETYRFYEKFRGLGKVVLPYEDHANAP